MLDVVILGAGPYGLSIASHVGGKSLQFRAFGEIMHSWAKCMPAGMELKSDGFASDLSDPQGRYTLASYCQERNIPYAPASLPIGLDTFIGYGRWFQMKAAPQLEPKNAERVETIDGGYLVTLSDGEQVVSRNVVVAVGITHFRHIPKPLSDLPSGAISHSAAHNDPNALNGREVTIIGRGASALDLAMLAHEAGAQVRVVARKGAIDFHDKAAYPQPLLSRLRRPMSRLGAGWRNLLWADFPLVFSCLPDQTRVEIARTFLGPAPGWTVRPRVEGKFPILLGREILGAAYANGKVTLELGCEDGRRENLVTDHVIAATGYKADLERLTFLAPSLRASIKTLSGAPRVSRQFESSAPGLYFAGLAAANTFGPVMRFAAGAPFAARRLSAALADRARAVRGQSTQPQVAAAPTPAS